ncbi:Non-structural maintenance of chromosomes element 3 [Liparis tanakae]|uniref:Non-structural maintenance of chromosomes element 3 n=1 Tax=Liparis tanakae TaxID=230148 RepID=A0A4Z2F4M1_9TELE|nr:Non-structural maintenance of chromosomes element 3 [Liparis tanakae]
MSQRKRLSSTPSPSQGKRPSSSSVAREENDDTAFTQPSSTQVQKGMEKLTPAQVDQKTAEVVQYFLVKDQKKIPVRRAELVKHVVKEYRNIYPEIMKRAARTFDQVFGLKMIEIDAKNHMYILINKLEPGEGPPTLRSPTNTKMGLLFVILSVVFMKGGVVRESEEKHEEFGDVKRLVTDEFVRQRARVSQPIDSGLYHTTEQQEAGPRPLQRAGPSPLQHSGLDQNHPTLYEQDPQTWTQQHREAHSGSGSSQTASSSQR